MSRQNTKCPTVDRKETVINTNRNSTGKGDTDVRKGKRSTETGRAISFADREIPHKSNKRNRNEDKDNVSESQPLKKKKSPDVNETFPDVANIDRQKCNEVLPTSRKRNRNCEEGDPNALIPPKTKTYSEVVKEKTTNANDTDTCFAVIGKRNDNDSECTDNWEVVKKRKRRAGPDDKSHFQQACTQPYVERPVSTEPVADLVTTYTVNYQTWSIPCLKFRADISQSEETPDIFFREGEVTVTKLTGKDKFEALKLCTIFDDSFVKDNKNSFKKFWEEVLKYVMEEKHKIDLHGMSQLIALAAVEFAVTRERHNNKDLHGCRGGSYDTLKIITGQGIHSSGSPVLCNKVKEHLNSLKCRKFTPLPGSFEVDTRYKI